ncbi:MAG: VCBS repeat-containing protein, partial [Pseudomonadota bacterium]
MSDTTAPRGTLLIPVFTAIAYGPYGLSNVGGFSTPTFADIDSDGDLDGLIGNSAGNILLFLNTGSASSPAFDAALANPYGLDNAGRYADPAFVDIDNDGDLDAFVGDLHGNTLFQLNTGTAGSPAFAAGVLNPYGLTRAGNYYASPTFADIDGDGDLDALIGQDEGNTLVFLNTGSSSAPAFAAASTNPYGLADVTYNARPTFVDIDGDGDLDALISNSFGNTLLSLNTGTPSSPAFAEPMLNPYGLFDIGHNANPAFADIDGDGDLDILMGDQWGDIQLLNNNPLAAIPVTSISPNGSYKAGDVITLQLHFDENVFVTGVPSLQLETGSTDRAAIYAGGSGSNILSFEYTVQAGDESSSLDINSSSALSLNAGTIADAAGNNAILTLADPGTPCSLAFNADLAIDTKAPGGTLMAPAFLTPAINPYGLDDIGASASPSFVDIDGDGDLDAFIGERYGSTVIQLNTGTAGSPAFAAAVTNPYGLNDVGKYAAPAFVDIDGDGDLDAFIGND